MGNIQDELFDFVYVVDRQGVLEKFLRICNTGLETAMEENNLSIWEIINMFDEVEEKTLSRGNQLILKSTKYLKWMRNRFLWKCVSRILDFPIIQRLIVKKVNKLITENMGNDERMELAV